MTIAELKGSEDCSNTSCIWVWGYAPPGKCLTFQPLRLFLVASETRLSVVGRSLSVISTGSPPLLIVKLM